MALDRVLSEDKVKQKPFSVVSFSRDVGIGMLSDNDRPDQIDFISKSRVEHEDKFEKSIDIADWSASSTTMVILKR